MDLREPVEAEAFRTKVRSFLSANLPEGWQGIGALDADESAAFRKSWGDTLYEHGYLAVSWPTEYGGAGLTKLEQVVLAEEFAKAGVPDGRPLDGFGIKMLGHTLLHWGTEEQKQTLLPRILNGTDKWCQGYSEPNAGSDLGNVGTRAELVGDEWIVNGQKIWTSGAHHANRIFAVCRTDPSVPKHRGISFLLVPMDQEGVEVRPIKMISGTSEFNEVFFTNARTAADNVVGPVNGGWSVAMTLLGHERGEDAAINHILFGLELDRLTQLMRERGADRDPVLRQRLAACYMEVSAMRSYGYRTLSRLLKGESLGLAPSISKLHWSHYHQKVTELAMDVYGLESNVERGKDRTGAFRSDEPGAPNSTAAWIATFLGARAGTIYAGSSEIQRNIIGEMGLGLPKEPRADQGPWGAAAKAAASA